MTLDLIILFVLLYLGGACSVYIALRCELLRDKSYVQLGSLAFFFVVAGLIGARLFHDWLVFGPVMVVISVGPGCLLYVPLLVFGFANLFATVKTRALGDHRLTLKKTYDQAEAAEKKRDYARALEIYDKALAEDPADHEAMRRKGELYLVMGKPEEAIRELRRVYERLAYAEAKASVGFRIADLLARERKDRQSARAFLTRLADVLDGTRFAEMAHACIAKLP